MRSRRSTPFATAAQSGRFSQTWAVRSTNGLFCSARSFAAKLWDATDSAASALCVRGKTAHRTCNGQPCKNCTFLPVRRIHALRCGNAERARLP